MSPNMCSMEEMKLVSIFFYLSLMPEKLALSASIKTLRALKVERSKGNLEEKEIIPFIVRSTHKVFNSLMREPIHIARWSRGSDWVFPEGMDREVWKDFRKKAQQNEFMMVLWSKVLNFKDCDIATGLCVSEGTVRHRLTRGLRLLGAGVHSRGANHVSAR